MSYFHRTVRSNRFKVVLMVFAVALFCWLLTYIIPDEAEVFYIKLRVDCDGIYEINCDYYLGGELQGSRGEQNANPENPIPHGETIWFEFTRGDFEFPDKLKSRKFNIGFYVTDMDGCDFPALFRDNDGNALAGWESSVRFDKEYDLALSCEDGEYFYTQIAP